VDVRWKGGSIVCVERSVRGEEDKHVEVMRGGGDVKEKRGKSR